MRTRNKVLDLAQHKIKNSLTLHHRDITHHPNADYMKYKNHRHPEAIEIIVKMFPELNDKSKWIQILYADFIQVHGQLCFREIQFRLYRRRRNTKYAKGADKDFVRWLTAHKDITKQTSEGNKYWEYNLAMEVVPDYRHYEIRYDMNAAGDINLNRDGEHVAIGPIPNRYKQQVKQFRKVR